MTDTGGNSLGTMKYYPYGSTRSGSVPTDELFTGQKLDGTGLYYYGARYYDPAIGRFISPDTVIPDPLSSQGWNRYSYCLNNPLKYVDPSGHFSIDDLVSVPGLSKVDDETVIELANEATFEPEVPDGFDRSFLVFIDSFYQGPGGVWNFTNMDHKNYSYDPWKMVSRTNGVRKGGRLFHIDWDVKKGTHFNSDIGILKRFNETKLPEGFKYAGKITKGLMVVGVVVDTVDLGYSYYLDGNTFGDNFWDSAGRVGGGWAGAAAGAAVGTLICPGLGTVLGAFVGGIGGGFLGEAAVGWIRD